MQMCASASANYFITIIMIFVFAFFIMVHYCCMSDCTKNQMVILAVLSKRRKTCQGKWGVTLSIKIQWSSVVLLKFHSAHRSGFQGQKEKPKSMFGSTSNPKWQRCKMTVHVANLCGRNGIKMQFNSNISEKCQHLLKNQKAVRYFSWDEANQFYISLSLFQQTPRELLF